MKRYVLTAFIILMFFVFFFMHSTFAQFNFPKGKWWKHPEVQEKIRITDEQIQKIENISNDAIRRIIELEGEYKIAKLDLENLIDQIDQKELNLEVFEKHIDVVNKLKGELDKERLMMLARIRNVLAKETIQELRKLRGKLRKRFKEKKKGHLENNLERGLLDDNHLERPRHLD